MSDDRLADVAEAVWMATVDRGIQNGMKARMRDICSSPEKCIQSSVGSEVEVGDSGDDVTESVTL